MSRPHRVKLQTLGCRLNEAELEAWGERFQRQGLQVVAEGEPADLVVINTCAVTQEAVRKSRQILRKSHRALPTARLVISGCLASLEADALAREAGVDLVVSNADKDRLVDIALETLEIPAMPELAVTDVASPLFARGRQRAFVKVQDGCRYQCTFCITTQARGDERSRPMDEVVEAIKRLHGSGVKEVVLTGVHLGGYGIDLGADLAGLIERVLTETEIPRLRIGSLEPWDLPDAFWDLFQDPRLMPHLHLPLQSGSDAVLKRMARRCKTHEFARLVARGRQCVPDLNVTTDIIVGFPGESDADWRQTLDFAAAMAFGHIHIFSYSPRAGTLAAKLSDPVDAAIKKARCQDLQGLLRCSKLAVMRAQIGKRVSLLHESPSKERDQPWRAGYTPNYLPVRLVGSPGEAGNRILDVELTEVDAENALILARPVAQSEISGSEVGPI
ncbi:tRNA (N(6)-L-threonylcarbamoyladenosine(37)-C(2))-methylthiotransferase MtaB [Thiorhodococcus mannitoliphagus]|uniref:tRNA (N(6)-L-threonylcarbamoyladenosine(37)-C(2))-methylthiotransferase MtaB n=1 Tax=Thiorhodococcus mannitoliphagus TaxID=329406 RepID=A0A6P1E160_9GAMM|nr:tRNA (N(6)-L-threonylcarbamoyladenosine(37)-C(2))-methylthiotransferase MtaB [Thiorhodococcus mannitoliphagus]NEX21724.1 tRNA (N(6)-L-threonylcarbamoyladenosine(37)-C(2))-methylthiotransferase MtaB [Thiorhodococcus mannitoliphagus]